MRFRGVDADLMSDGATRDVVDVICEEANSAVANVDDLRLMSCRTGERSSRVPAGQLEHLDFEFVIETHLVIRVALSKYFRTRCE